jgi:hypothetical protein
MGARRGKAGICLSSGMARKKEKMSSLQLLSSTARQSFRQ